MKKIRILFVLMLILSVSLSSVAFAEETAPVTEALGTAISVPLFSEPQKVTLPRAVTSFWFMMPYGTEVGKAEVTLIVDSADCIIEEYSFATLRVNNYDVETINLVSLRGQRGGVWKVEIPVEYLKCDGTLNQLSIITAQRTILGDCADIDNLANWLIISDESTLDLQIISMGEATLSTLYDCMFNRVDGLDSIRAAFLPEGKEPAAELSAMFSMASSFGAAYPYKSTVLLPVGQNEAFANSVVISASQTAPVLKAGEGYLKIENANGGCKVIVSGADTAGLKKAADIMLYNSYLSQLSGQEKVIASSVKPASTGFALNEDHMYTLADYGYEDISLEGAFHQSTSFDVRQPNGIRSGADSYFELHFRHSAALLGDSSLLTVYFNHVAYSSVQLSSTNAANGVLRVRIPADVLDDDRITVTVEVYNYLGKIDCSKDWSDVAWSVIDSDSVFYFQDGDTTVTPDLASFPALPSVAAGQEHKVVVSLPDMSNEKVLEAANELICVSAQKSLSAASYTVVDKVDSQTAANADIFIFGSVSDITLPAEICEKLYIFPENGSFTIKEGIPTIPEAVSDKLILQVIASPYDYTRVIYVVMWPDQGEDMLLSFTQDRDQINAVSGVVALAGGASSGMVPLSSANEVRASVPLTPEVVINRVVNQTGISRIGLLIILLLIIIIIIFIIRAILKKNRFEKAKRKMEETNGQTEDTPAAGQADQAEQKNDDDDDDDDE